jgi:hypothetical protein
MLLKGALEAMLIAIHKFAVAVTLTAGLVLGVTGLGFAQALADKPEAKAVDPLSERFDKLHRTILPQKGELNWLSVPWLTSITLGQHQAAVQNKPLFIFADTGAGFADALGLC